MSEQKTAPRSIQEIVDELKAAIANSSEYKEFQAAGIQLDKTPDLRQQVDAARRDLFLAQNSESGETPEEVSKRYAQLFTQRPAERYHNAEVRFSRLIQKVCRALVSDLNFDTEFLDQ